MEEAGRFRRRRLPHWDLPGATYFVTTCLAGSIPAEGLLELARFRGRSPRGASRAGRQAQWKARFLCGEAWLDRRAAVRHLGDAALAAVVADACFHWAGIRYDLFAYVVMPSHLHWVFRPLPGVAAWGAATRSPRERILHTLKRHTARECNRRLGRHGAFWQDESYDHCVRDEEELLRIIQYVEFNPVQAGLVAAPEQWRFSSAFDRVQAGLPYGQPLLRTVPPTE